MDHHSAQPSRYDRGALNFRDVAAESGLTFRWGPNHKHPQTILDTLGHECAFYDPDRDGTLDVLPVGEPMCANFSNRGGARFEDATVRAGLSKIEGPWKGCAIGDYDADDVLEVFLTGSNALALLRGAPDGGHHDVTRHVGL